MLAQDIKDLFVSEGFIRYKHKLEKFKAPYVLDSPAAHDKLQEIKSWYAEKLMVRRDKAVPMVNALFGVSSPQEQEAVSVAKRRRSALDAADTLVK